MKHAIARLHWLDARSGGRQRPVTGLRYMCPVRVGTGEDAWTLVVHRSQEAARDEETVLVHFLMEDAPHEWLETNTVLRLLEGERVIAEGKVSETFELSAAA